MKTFVAGALVWMGRIALVAGALGAIYVLDKSGMLTSDNMMLLMLSMGH